MAFFKSFEFFQVSPNQKSLTLTQIQAKIYLHPPIKIN